MAGSGDIEGLEDVLVNYAMTELEAIIFIGITNARREHLDWDDADLARHLAQWISYHSPTEIPHGDDDPA